MRWRLRLSEFDFTVKYKRGVLNTQADALSRLPTNGETSVEIDDEIPCYMVDFAHELYSDEELAQRGLTLSENPAARLQKKLTQSNEPVAQGETLLAQSENDLFSAEEQPDFLEFEFAQGDSVLVASGKLLDEELLKAITREELADAQQQDRLCKDIRSQLTRGEGIPFAVDKSGVLIRTVNRDFQLVVPESLRPRVLNFTHHATLGGAPGGRKLYNTLRKGYYWPSMALDAYATVRNCAECARNRVKLRRKSSTLKLFPAQSPLESVALDILGELIRTPRGNRYLLVIADRFTKLVRTVPLKRITAYSVARAFVHNWIFVYGIPLDVLTDNGAQFASRFFADVCRILRAKLRFTTTYHPQANGQVERFNRTIKAALRHYIGEHPKDWDLYTDVLTFAYNCQVHSSTNYAPFELVLSRPPAQLAVGAIPKVSELYAENRSDWRARLSTVIENARTSLKKAQERYKRNFDNRLRLPARDPKAGYYVVL